jgi:Immune inhibitor A-like, MAM domain
VKRCSGRRRRSRRPREAQPQTSAGGPTLDFDYLVVEAHTVGQHDWTTFNAADGTRSNAGSAGTWNAANGSSSGWQQFEVGLAPFAGRQIEVSITTLSDWGLQQFPGAFIDDIEVSTGEGSTSFENDADPMDGWTVPGAPQDAQGIEAGLWLRGHHGAGTRNAIMDRAIDYLLR